MAEAALKASPDADQSDRAGSPSRRSDALMSIKDAIEMEKAQARACDYYSIFLKNDVTDEFVRVRTHVWKLDAERKPVLENGSRVQRNAHDVALDVWAAYGAEDHTLEMVLRGGHVVATPASIAAELAMKNVTGALIVFGRRGIVRSYLPILYLVAICGVAFAVGDSFGAVLTIIGVIAWTSVCLMLIYMFLFKDFMARIRESWNEDSEEEDDVVVVAAVAEKIEGSDAR